MSSQLLVTYKKSSIGYSQRQKDTVRSLGLRRLGQSVIVPDNLAIRGMVHQVQHLVTAAPVIVEDGGSEDTGTADAQPADAGATSAAPSSGQAVE